MDKNDEMIIFLKKKITSILEDNFLGIRYHKLDAPIAMLHYLGSEIEEAGSNGVGLPTTSILTMKLREKVLQVQDFNVSASMTRTAIEDIKTKFGVDLVAKTLDVLLNELRYSVERLIIEKIDENSEEHANMVVEEVPQQLPAYKIFINRFLTAIRFLINGKKLFKPALKTVTTKKPFDLKTSREFVSKIMKCCNRIAIISRRGPGNFVICNVAVGTILQNEENFVAEPSRDIVNVGNNIYKLGVLNNIPIYINPNMVWDSDYFYVGRKEIADNSPDNIGLNIGHYENGISLQTVAEATMAPKLSLSARFFIEELSDVKGRYFKVKYNPNTMISGI